MNVGLDRSYDQSWAAKIRGKSAMQTKTCHTFLDLGKSSTSKLLTAQGRKKNSEFSLISPGISNDQKIMTNQATSCFKK